MEKAFEIHGLNKEYKGFALKNVNLELPKGYIMGFVGKNGAGKSTTMNCLLGITNPDSGDVKIFGKEIKNLIRPFNFFFSTSVRLVISNVKFFESSLLKSFILLAIILIFSSSFILSLPSTTTILSSISISVQF